MDWEFLIPLLMFAFPVVVALLDKRARQKRAASPSFPQPNAREQVSRELAREFSPEAAGGVAPENRSHPRLRKREGPADEVSGRGPAQQDVFGGNPAGSQEFGQEGIRAVHKNGPQEAPEPVQPADKLKIDKKKLIIYSEILKPKFDA